MDRIDGKFKTSLDRRYKLPKARYVGKVATQRIRLSQKPKIEAVVEDEDSASVQNASKNGASGTKKKKKNKKKKKSQPVFLLNTRKYSFITATQWEIPKVLQRGHETS